MIEFLTARSADLWLRTGEHLILTGVSTGFAIAIGIPLGIAAARYRYLRGPLLGAVGILQTVPSLAMLALLLALLGQIGATPAIVALTLYALLPITRNTLTGLDRISPDVIEAARGIGMTERQQLWMIKIPLATPVVVAGVRTAAVIGVGIATLAAFIGAGGLGQFIIRGLALSDTPLILLGAIPAAILALLVDGAIAGAEWGLQPTRQTEEGTLRARLKPLGLLAPAALVVLGFVAHFTGPGPVSATEGEAAASIRVGSKNFTEQFVLGELMAQLIEARTDLDVERRFALGGTMIVHDALTGGELDLYAEYTGTALTAILGRPPLTDPDSTLRVVRGAYRDRWDVDWLAPFGFDNAYAVTVRRADAERRGWRSISDLGPAADELRAGFTSEFMERPDGYPAVRRTYGIAFGDVRDMEPTLMYEAVARGGVDVISAFATDGRIRAYDLMTLSDDRNAFPPYHAAPVVRLAVLQAHPRLRNALEPLAGALDDSTMRALNFEVDEHGRSPREAARDFLMSRDLIDSTE